MDYRSAGVDIDEGTRAVRLIREKVAGTATPGVMGGIGGFGGLYSLASLGVDDPVLVSSIDGVGTKLTVARLAGRYDTVGADLVNHCANDILVQGARPLFFLDYVAMGRLQSEVVAAIVGGMASACRELECAILGGETAEMPGLYAPGDFDVVGAIVGVVGRAALIDGSSIRPGQVAVGLDSTGLHTNGYSLARAVIFDRRGLSITDPLYADGPTVGDALLAVHRCYWPALRPSLDAGLVTGLAHITGGGLVENVPRVLPQGVDVEIDWASWEVPAVFRSIQEWGEVSSEEMFRTFNMGIGLVVFCEESDADRILEWARDAGDTGRVIGRVVEGSGRVVWAE